ncbi:hypothetical protein [Cellulomonas sp. URHB0016]
MSDTSEDSGARAQEGGYGYPTLEQEVTPEVLEAGAGSHRSGESPAAGTEATEPAEGGDDGNGPTPGELAEDPPVVEPTD